MATPVGPPFGSSFGPSDPRSCTERLEDLHRIYEQVSNINRRQSDPAVRNEVLRLLRERRAGDTERAQFDLVPDPRGDFALVVPGELVIRTEALERNARIEQQFATADRTTQTVAELDNRLVRLPVPDVRESALVERISTLRSRSVDASPNYVTSMGGVMKGLSGPELSAAQEIPSRPAPGHGNPVRVAVIDTGIMQRSDDWLTGLVRPDNVDPLDEMPTPDGFLDLGAGHGTFVAGVVQQVAPGADISVYRALDSDGIGDNVEIAGTMVRAAREGAQIINLSCGLETLGDLPPVAFQVALEIIEEISAERGQEILVVAAAGNFGRSRPCWPGAFHNVVAVAGLTQRLRPSMWSSRGSWVDCSTLAEGVWSTYVPGQESPFVDSEPEEFPLDAWALWTGTSFAAPQIAGVVAKIAQEQGLAPRTALNVLLDGLAAIPEYGKVVPVLAGI